MASKFSEGDRVRTTSSWTGKSDGNGTVVTVADGGCGVQLDRQPEVGPVHYYDSELTQAPERR